MRLGLCSRPQFPTSASKRTRMPIAKISCAVLCLLLAGAGAAPAAQAAPQDKIYEFPAADACQLSVPTTDTRVRPKASGYRNEGSTSQFVICGMGGYESGTVLYTTLIYTSMDGAPHSMSCTGVAGLTGSASPLAYSTKTVSIAATGYSFMSWGAEDFGGSEGAVIAAGSNLSVTCTLPPNVALQGFESEQLVDVGA